MRLWAWERRRAAEIFDGMLPPGANGRFFLGAREAGVVEFFEAHLGFMPARTRWAMRAAVDVVGAYASVHRDGARGALQALARSPIYAMREVVTLLKQVVCMGYFSDLRVRDELGLDRPLERPA